MFPGNFPLDAFIAFFVVLDASLLFFHCVLLPPVPLMRPKEISASQDSLPRVPIVYLGPPALPYYTPPPRAISTASTSAMFTMEGLIELNLNIFRNVKSTLDG